ncbi:MAG: di-heme oxidoredictase family protein [Rhizobiaceae bacterium]
MGRKIEFGIATAAVAVVLVTGLGITLANQGALGLALQTSSAPVSEPRAEEAESYRPLAQAFLNELAHRSGQSAAFAAAFEAGDELTELNFTAANGVGANVGEGRRFSRMPRADLGGDGEWSTHLPKREGGPNATSCIACHNRPGPNGAGDVALNAVIDPTHIGQPSKFLERNTLPLMALGVPQRIAEEMSLDLAAQRKRIYQKTCADGRASGRLTTKGVSFGQLSAVRTTATPCKVSVDYRELRGIDRDLIVKPFGWKGNQPTIRAFTRNAAHNELGLQAVELIAEADGDRDGVSNELTVGDMTALTVYMAALERPVTKIELAALGLSKMTDGERAAILKGESAFGKVGCAACHVPSLELEDPIFSEPSDTPGFFDAKFPSGDDPDDHLLSYGTAIRFDLTSDQPNNQISLPGGEVVNLAAITKTKKGGGIAQWYSDFKRHDMGEELADPTDAQGINARMWLTRSLAGVGSTGPWLHDGRATTLNDAILAHGGEAGVSRDSYTMLPQQDRENLIAFLENLVIYKQEEEE